MHESGQALTASLHQADKIITVLMVSPTVPTGPQRPRGHVLDYALNAQHKCTRSCPAVSSALSIPMRSQFVVTKALDNLPAACTAIRRIHNYAHDPHSCNRKRTSCKPPKTRRWLDECILAGQSSRCRLDRVQSCTGYVVERQEGLLAEQHKDNLVQSSCVLLASGDCNVSGFSQRVPKDPATDGWERNAGNVMLWSIC
jgi:hypothetical protein